MANVRGYNNKQRLLLPPSIEDYLAKDDLAHVVDDVVERIDLSPYFEEISPVGNPSYHPAMMIKILTYGYATGVPSSRKIEKKLHTDVGFIYLSGMQKPDFKTISEFRREHHKQLKHTFNEVVRVCHEMGMTDLGEISLDGTVMKGNASPSRSYKEEDLLEAIEEYLKQGERTDREEDEKYGKDRRGDELPEGLSDRQERKRRMDEAIERIKKAQKKLEETGEKKINLTDDDAQFQKDKGRKFTLGYRGQVAVDEKEQIIIVQQVTNEKADTGQLIPVLDEVLETVSSLQEGQAAKPQDKIKVSADAGYSSGPNLQKLEDPKYRDRIDAHIPDGIYQGRESERLKESEFSKEKFVYDEQTDEYICPAGKRLYQAGRRMERNDQGSTEYRCRDCKGCELFEQCTTNKRGRTIKVLDSEPLIKKMREKLSTPEGKKIYSHRKRIVEPVFGNIKYNGKISGFLLRGLSKVGGEFSLICTVHNVIKIGQYLKRQGLNMAQAMEVRAQLVPVNSS